MKPEDELLRQGLKEGDLVRFTLESKRSYTGFVTKIIPNHSIYLTKVFTYEKPDRMYFQTQNSLINLKKRDAGKKKDRKKVISYEIGR